MADEAKQQFQIQRIYTKDLSFESPNAPKVFLQQEWKPEISVDLNVSNSDVEKDVREVVLTLTLTAKVKEETAFLAEIKQAGIFQINGFDDAQMKHMLGAFCPNILFPYAREVVSDLVNRGSFPQLLLAPINFEALYQQQLKAAADAKEGKKEKAKEVKEEKK